ncbi:MAG: outer membrane lipoprotein-sorting protein [Thermodesulfobacteriota bacterium]
MKLLSIALAGLLALAASAYAADAPSLEAQAREIMQKVHDRDDGKTAVMEQEMILIDKKGGQRVRRIKSYGKDFGKDSYSIMFFLEPADVRDTSFLTYDYDQEDKDDDQWLYLPALKKVKRIASKDKDGSFMGSDFTYGDMTKRELSKFTYKILQEDTVNGQKCWVIEATPINDDVVDEYGYTKSIVWVRQDNFVVIRAKFWEKSGGKVKYMDMPKLELIKGIWTPMEITMTTKKGNNTEHATVLKTLSVTYDVDLPDSDFSTTRMEKGH